MKTKHETVNINIGGFIRVTTKHYEPGDTGKQVSEAQDTAAEVLDDFEDDDLLNKYEGHTDAFTY